MNVEYYRDFLPFYLTSQLKQPTFNGILIGCAVPNASRTEFEEKIRTFGSAFKNYYINARDSSNLAYAANQPVYYPYYMVVPESILAINMGYDVASNPIRKTALLKAAFFFLMTVCLLLKFSRVCWMKHPYTQVLACQILLLR
jgi:CHASE1-domain containing sensor protein